MKLLRQWWGCSLCKLICAQVFAVALCTAGYFHHDFPVWGFVLALLAGMNLESLIGNIRDKISQRAPNTYNTGSAEQAERIADRYIEMSWDGHTYDMYGKIIAPKWQTVLTAKQIKEILTGDPD